MGTNYYLNCEKEGISMRLLHIGKKSMSWRFTWKGYKGLENSEDWLNFLKLILCVSDEFMIKNEYHQEINYEDFLKILVGSPKDKEGDNFLSREFS